MAITPPRLSIADQLEQASYEFDLLIRDARTSPRGSHDDRHAELEERAQAIAASIVAPFRGVRAPTAAPIAMQTQGGKSEAWF